MSLFHFFTLSLRGIFFAYKKLNMVTLYVFRDVEGWDADVVVVGVGAADG